jgi:hypothetical protein
LPDCWCCSAAAAGCSHRGIELGGELGGAHLRPSREVLRAQIKVREGKIVYIYDHEDREAALEAAGLSE